MTGIYLSLSMTRIGPLLYRLLPVRVKQYLDVANGLQVPFVVGGVGTWGGTQSLGFLPGSWSPR